MQHGASNDTGGYAIPDLNPGSDSFKAVSNGFRTYKPGELTLTIGVATESRTVNDLLLNRNKLADLALLTGGVIPKGAVGCSSFPFNGVRRGRNLTPKDHTNEST